MAKKDAFWVNPVFDQDGVQSSAGIGTDGKEYGDPVPLAPAVELRRPDTMQEIVRQLFQSEMLRYQADLQGFDSPEEADDFDIEDDPVDPLTPWEEHFEMPRKGATAPAGASNGGPQPQGAPQPVANQTASSGSDVGSSKEMKVEKPSVGSPGVSPSGTSGST